MPRQARLDASGLVHHVMARGIEGDARGRCEGDAGHLVQLLGAVGVRGRDKGWLFAHFTRNSTK
jgi:hypothetical protein